MDPPEELRAIGGIGPSRARWLAETLGVKSAADLAALSPSELEERVRDPAAGFPRPYPRRREIESWVVQAQVMVSKTGEGRLPPEEVAEQGTPVTPPAAAVVTAAPAQEQEVSGVESVSTEEAAVRRPELPPRLAHFQASVVDGDGMEPANLIRLDKGWAVVFTWSLEDTTLLVPGGEWELAVVGRPLGRSGPPPLEQKPGRVPMQPGRDAYRQTLEVPAGVIMSSHSDPAYRYMATLSYRRQPGDVALVAGVLDLGVLRFYVPKQS